MPDFFIAGMPKCGTTALYDYLSTHPGVFMPHEKEPGFFCSDFPDLAVVQDLAAYRKLFSPAPKGALLGEASVWYFYSAVAIPEILKLYPHAKFIVMLRNPVEAARSLHTYRLKTVSEDIEDFEAAWNAQSEGASGRRLPRFAPHPARLQYGKVFAYANAMERMMERVPKRQRHVVLFEEFFADPQKGYSEILQFLDLPPDGRAAFPVSNPAAKIKSKAIARLLRWRPRGAGKLLLAPLLGIAHRLGIRPHKILQEINNAPTAKTALRPEFAAQIYGHFAEDVRRLEGLLGRPLDIWRRP